MSSTLRIVILAMLMTFFGDCRPSLKCMTYLLELNTLYQTNKGLCMNFIENSYEINGSLHALLRETAR